MPQARLTGCKPRRPTLSDRSQNCFYGLASDPPGVVVLTVTDPDPQGLPVRSQGRQHAFLGSGKVAAGLHERSREKPMRLDNRPLKQALSRSFWSAVLASLIVSIMGWLASRLIGLCGRVEVLVRRGGRSS